MSDTKQPEDFARVQFRFCVDLVSEALACGVTHFYICPGSRSAPLALACDTLCPERCFVHFDERGAAFAALGSGRVTRRPAAVITTSGTAVANLLPAVIEASEDGVPLLLITADRPAELIGCGANQTFDQTQCLRSYCAWFFDIPPIGLGFFREAALAAIDEAVHRCGFSGGGAVHLNVRLREPLLSSGMCQTIRWHQTKQPHISIQHVEGSMLPDIFEQLGKHQISSVVCGGLRSRSEMSLILGVLRRVKKPVYLDVCSGLRGVWPHTSEEQIVDLARNGEVLRLGGRLVNSKLEKAVAAFDTVVLRAGRRRIHPYHQKATVYVCDLETSGTSEVDCTPVDQVVGEPQLPATFNDSSVVKIFDKLIPSESILFLGNSRVIREFDKHWLGWAQPRLILANRGASGIDGNIATAVGVGIASGMTTVAVVGDQSALHDLNSFGLLASVDPVRSPIKVIILNNGGGKIFEMLGHTQHTRRKEIFLGIPISSFSGIADLFGLSYYRATDVQSCEKFMGEALRQPGHTIIELLTTYQR